MPTYEYSCDKCGLHFEKVQSMKESALAVCPKELCGRKRWGRGRVRRLMGAGAGLIFKGSGFYITDYRSENYKQAAKKDAPPAPAPAADAKPATPAAKSGGDSKPAPAAKP
ncbi:MAG: zinc ribbon domain-containing protein [Verrucomicrobia bacterium]|nr:zinc ribbon domain-containing protein [Verrucomicrobiota bacterium]